MKQRDRSFLVLLGLVILAGFLGTSLFSFWSARTSLRKQIVDSELPLTSDNIYSEIQRDLLQPVLIASFMASDAFLRDWSIAGEKDPEQIRRYLAEVQVKYNTFTSFFVSEKSQKYYHSSGVLKSVHESEPRDAWYFRVRNMADTYEINVDPDLANRDALTIFINHKVFDYNGGFIGATGVGLTVNAVIELIDKYEKAYERRISFVDSMGTYMVNGRLGGDSIKNVNQVDGLNEVAKQLKNKTQGYQSVRRQGTLVHVNIRYIPELSWYLVVEQEEAKGLTLAYRTLWMNLGISFVVSLLVLLSTWWVLGVHRKQLESLAITDKLTGIYNRHAFSLLYRQTQKSALRDRKLFSLILLDIDRFKSINDKFGHQCGDSVIVSTVQCIRKAIRDSDPIFRWGGEEFLVLLPGCSEYEAQMLAYRILTLCREQRILWNSQPVVFTVSAGLATAHEGEESEVLIQRADKALMLAKDQGRDRVVFTP